MHKVFIFLHTSFQPNCGPRLLYEAGKPFLCGNHFFKDRAHMLVQAEIAKMDRGLPYDTTIMHAETKDVYIQESVTPPPLGGYEDGSFCIFNKQPYEHIEARVAELLEADPNCLFVVVAREGYPTFVQLVEWLQANHRERHVSVFARECGSNLLVLHDDDRAELTSDSMLWSIADLRYCDLDYTKVPTLSGREQPQVVEDWKVLEAEFDKLGDRPVYKVGRFGGDQAAMSAVIADVEATASSLRR